METIEVCYEIKPLVSAVAGPTAVRLNYYSKNHCDMHSVSIEFIRYKGMAPCYGRGHPFHVENIGIYQSHEAARACVKELKGRNLTFSFPDK